jgi:hypothetical protein
MNRHITSVGVLWEEFTKGCYNGLAVNKLVENYGFGWIQGSTKERNATKKWYQRRLVVVKEVEKLIRTEGISESVAIDRVELIRGRESLNWLGEELKRRTKSRKSSS